MRRSVFLGWDTREAVPYAVALHSLRRHLTGGVSISRIDLHGLRGSGLYTRPMARRRLPNGRQVMWDVISGAPQSTEHANARFLVRELAKTGWVLFTDCDVLFRSDVDRLFDMLDPDMAVYCVQHDHRVVEGEGKMDGQVQVNYQRKNWSSVFALNCDHPANRALTVEMVNTLPGRDLHRFSWLSDDLIGALPLGWNYLVGVSEPVPADDVHIAHFTLGTPDMPGYELCEFADEWWSELQRHRWPDIETAQVGGD